MNILTIQKLTLKNFKGLKNFTLEPAGQNLFISGDNASGKTTIIDAFFWLLFDKDSHSKSDFQLKPVNESGQEKHNLEIEVEAILEINNKLITLKKRFQEKYTKKRGQAMAEFTGHTTDYFINDVLSKKGEYNTRIAKIINIDTFKLITNPLEFNNLHWQDRRQILFKICGDIPDQTIIDSDPNLSLLTDILIDCSINDHKKKIIIQKRNINKELLQIPVRISENKEFAKDSEKPNLNEKNNLDKTLEKKKEILLALRSNEALSAKRIRLNEINSEILKVQNNIYQKQTEAKKPVLNAITDLETKRRKFINEINTIKDEIKRDNSRNKLSETVIVDVRKEWHIENDKQPSGNNTCPNCGQSLPEDQIKNAIKTFNQLKADKLEKITIRGKEMAINIDQRKNDIQTAQNKKNKFSISIVEIDAMTETKKAELKQIGTTLAKTDILDKEKIIIESEINALLNGSSIQEETALRYIQETQNQLEVWNKTYAKWNAAEKATNRIVDLKKQEKIMAIEFERLESELFLIENFIIKKVEMLEEQINNNFKIAHFKLFNTQINGGVEECCETLFKGVPFGSSLNSAAKINVGLDIINTLSEYYNFSAPIFIDNAESINEIIPVNTQMIKLIVSKDDQLIISKTKN